jgi:hypothetical protein
MLSIHLRLGLPSGLFPSAFPTNNLYTFLFSPIRATCPAHLFFTHNLYICGLGIVKFYLCSFDQTSRPAGKSGWS